MQKRSEVDQRYKWDLSIFVKDEHELESNIKYLKDNAKRYSDFYGKLGERQYLIEYLKFDKEYSDIFEKTAAYIGHTLNTDTSDSKYITYSQRLEFISKDCSEASAYVGPQLSDLSDEYLNQIINDAELKNYKRFFQSILRGKPHKIKEQDNQLLSKMSLCFGNDGEVYDTLTNGEIKFEDIEDSEGNRHEVFEADYSKFLDSNDPLVRERAFKSIMNGYGGKVRTIACLYTNDIQSDIFYNNLTNFTSTREKAMFGEEVDEKVYNTLINNINNRISVLQDILQAKAKHLNVSKMAYYDMFLTIGEKANYSIEQAINLVKDCVKPLGEEYQALLDEKFNQGVIDYLPNENKITGAYSAGATGCPSIVLMNYVGDYSSVSTLAHEIGHAMHTEFSDRAQPWQLANYVIFVAEVASTVNEILLNLHVAKTASKEGKIALSFKLLDNVRSTIFRQTLFSEFEDFSHSKLEAGEPLTYEDYNNIYYKLNQKYYGEVIELPDELKYEWARIPHFYTPFYVYKYATGFISALCIVQKLLEDENYYNQYIKFLKSGCTKSPVELLQDIGVDLTTDEPYDKAFKFIQNILNQVK